VKYSGEGREIDLCCARRNGHAVIAVTDRGIGIAPDDQPRVFEKFYRVRASNTDLIAGTGLGLTLVKHIAQAHGGSVDVESAPGKGSTFSIRIPVDTSGKGEASA
jgi:two-component system sensor histidine kinase SenX3